MMAAQYSSSSSRLQQALQSAVQSVQWTYGLFWHLCPQQGILVWGDGYYNGAIKTRKTVQPMEVSTEEASLQRSQQLRELYESLSAGETNNPPTRRPCAALSPEDLTESEWFYLMCVSFSFPPGVGLPGKAFDRQQPVWLTHANEADSKVFSRAILAKTVVCIPFMHGVLELGTTEIVEEDMELIHHAKSFFIDHHCHQPKPALSEHSTSNSVAHADQHLFHFQPISTITPLTTMDPNESNQKNGNGDDSDGDGDDEDNDDDDDDDGIEVGTDIDAEIETYDARVSTQHIMPTNLPASVEAPTSEPNELMQIEMSEDIRLGSPEDCSNNLDKELQMLIAGHSNSGQSDDLHAQDNSYRAWHLLDEDLYGGFPESSELSPEDAHYSETISVLLHSNSSRWSDPNSVTQLAHSRQSAFSKWSNEDHILPISFEGTSQWLLKYILFCIPNLHCKDKNENSPSSKDEERGSRFQKSTHQEELSANHVLAERRRREKLNERFIILRSLVPFVTKMDKASILGDTIEYVKQLRRRIQELESRNKQNAIDRRSRATEVYNSPNTSLRDRITTQPNCTSARANQNRDAFPETRKLRVVEHGEATASKSSNNKVEALSSSVQVSIIEADALLELQCPYRDGLLLQIMQTLAKLQLEITSVQSSSADGIFTAELRAKVKDIDRKKASIIEVKKAIYQVFSQ